MVLHHMLRHFGCCLMDTDIDTRAGRVIPAEKETMKGYERTKYEVKMASYIRNSYRRVWEKDGRYYTQYAGHIVDVTDRQKDFIYSV